MMDRYKFRGKLVGCDCKDFALEYCECSFHLDFPEEFYKDGFVYGYLVAHDVIALGIVETDDSAIVYEYWARVDPSTVDQYTGLKNKNGKEIYGGDIIEYVDFTYPNNGNVVKRGVVKWHENSAMFVLKNEITFSFEYLYISLLNDEEAELIGNIHDNPELLER